MQSFPHGCERTMRDAHNPAGGRMIIPPPKSSSHLSSSSSDIPGSLHPAYRSPVKQHQSSLTSLRFFYSCWWARGDQARWEEGRERETHTELKWERKREKKDDRLCCPGPSAPLRPAWPRPSATVPILRVGCARWGYVYACVRWTWVGGSWARGPHHHYHHHQKSDVQRVTLQSYFSLNRTGLQLISILFIFISFMWKPNYL